VCRLAPALAAVALAAASRAAPPPPEPPLDISADNVTGSRAPEGDVVLLHGHLRATRGRAVVTARDGRYLRAQGVLYLDGDVRMVDSTLTLACDHANYSEGEDVLELTGNVVVTDRDATLRAPSGTYYRRAGRAELVGGVEGRDRSQRLTCERATYLRDSLLVRARGPEVHGYDDAHHLEVIARAIDYDRGTHEVLATGDPELLARDERGKATRVRATTLRLNTETRVAEALDSVRVERDSLRAVADSARFDDVAERGWLLGRPRAWDDHTAVTGDSLELWTAGRRLQRVGVRGNAEMIYHGAMSDAAGESSRLTGQSLEAWFTDDQMDSLVAVGKARNQYAAAPAAGKTAETNTADGDSITVFFKERKIDRARVEGRAAGEYHLAVDTGDTTAAKKEIVHYDATRIHFVVPKSRLVLDHSAHLVYRDLELRARRVEYDVEHQTLVASGDPDLTDRGDRVTGHLMTYDMNTRMGTIYQAETAYERGLYHGEAIRKVNDKELDVMNGSYSTCDLEQPHYHFAAHWMKIYLKDKLVAKPVVFYVKNVPLLALPFWIFPIKPGRHSGFLFPQFEFGFNNVAGQFIRNAGYYWAPNDYMDATVSGDYYQAEPSWVLRGEGVYKLLYVLDGNFRGTFARNERLSRDDWDLTADHSQELTPRTRIAARASFVSSRDYSTSNLFGRSLYQRLNRFLTSSLALSHNADWASISAAIDRRQDLDADNAISAPFDGGPIVLPRSAPLANLAETAPSLSVSFPTRTIGSFGPVRGTWLEKPLSTMYFSLNSNFASLRERRALLVGYAPDNSAILEQRTTTRRAFGTTTSLSDSRRLFGWINVQPHLDAEGVVFDFDELGHHMGIGSGRTLTQTATGVWSSGVNTGATFYGTFRPHVGPLVGLRHVVSPGLSFGYSPEFKQLTFVDPNGVVRPRFSSFGGFGVSGFRQASMSFGLDQRLQAKVRQGDKVAVLDNLLSMSLRGSYNFLWREQHARHPLSNLSGSLFLQPPGVANASVGWNMDVYSPRPVRNLSYNLGLNLSSAHLGGAAPALPVDQGAPAETEFRDQWTLGIAYSYAGGYLLKDRWSSSQTANAVLQYRLSPGWGLDYSTSLDLSHRQAVTQRFGLSRDLHCWVATFSRTFTIGGEAEYYFRLGVKDQREIFVERGTRTGSIGGIQ
jgi:lipopolysaccharide assembly outer membrane protein LptD (OstA)